MNDLLRNEYGYPVNYDTSLDGRFGDWVKKTAKKVVNVTQDVGRTLVNTVAKPVTIFTGDKVYDKEDFETKVFQKGAGVTEKISDFTNRYINPATILIRNGIIASMKLNVMGVAKKLRWAYLSDAEVTSRKINRSELAKIKSKAKELQNIVVNQGGKAENLREAILTGKGNEDGKVPKGSNSLGYPGYIGNNGLGAAETAAAITAAAGVVSAIALALKNITALFPDKAQNQDFQQDSGPSVEEAEAMEASAVKTEYVVVGVLALAALGTIAYFANEND